MTFSNTYYIHISKFSFFMGDQIYQWSFVHKFEIWPVQGIKVWVFHLILHFDLPSFDNFFCQIKEGQNVKIKWKFQTLMPSTDWNTHFCTKIHDIFDLLWYMGILMYVCMRKNHEIKNSSLLVDLLPGRQNQVVHALVQQNHNIIKIWLFYQIGLLLYF